MAITDEAGNVLFTESSVPLADETLASPFCPLPSAPAFPENDLDVRVELNLGNTWTNITQWVFQDTTSIQSGHPDESTTTSPSMFTATLDNTDGRFSSLNPNSPYYGQLGLNTEIRVSIPAGAGYLRLESDGLSGAQFTPTSAQASTIAAGLDVQMDITPDNWWTGDQWIAGQWGNGSSSWGLLLNGQTEGQIEFRVSPDNVNMDWIYATFPAELNPRDRMCIRVNWVPGSLPTFWYSAPGTLGNPTWIQLTNTTGTFPATGAYATTEVVQIGAVGTQGMFGKVHGFKLADHTGATAIASVDFTTKTDGTTSWTDAQANTWSLWYTTSPCEISTRDYRFHGQVASWPQSWKPAGVNTKVAISAGGLLRRMSQGNSPTFSPMYRAMIRQTGYGLAPWAYWPMEDLANATQFASAIGGPPIPFAAPGPQPASNTSFTCSAALPVLTAGQPLLGTVPPYAVKPYGQNGSDGIVRFLMAMPSGGDAVGTIASVHFQGGSVARVDLNYPTANGGALGLFGYDANNTQLWGTNVIMSLPPENHPQLVSIEIEQTAANQYTPAFWVLGVNGPTAYGWSIGAQTGTVGRIGQVALNATGKMNVTAIGHLQVQSTWTSLFTLLQSPLNSWVNELAGVRFRRLCKEEGIPFRSMGSMLDTPPMGPQTIETIETLLQECIDADQGFWWEPRETLGFGFRTRDSVGNGSPRFILDYNKDHLTDDLSPTLDDQTVKNLITVTGQVSGSTSTQTLDDGSPLSIQVAGTYDSEVTVNIPDSYLDSEAGWILHASTVNEPRYTAINVDLANTALTTPDPWDYYYAILRAEIGDWIRIANPPPWLPPGWIDQVILGTNETLSRKALYESYNTRPYSPYAVAMSDDLVYGRADTSAAMLTTALPSPLLTPLVQTSRWQAVAGALTDAYLPQDGLWAPSTWALFTSNGSAGNFGPSGFAPVTVGATYIVSGLLYSAASVSVNAGLRTMTGGAVVSDVSVSSVSITAGVPKPFAVSYTVLSTDGATASPRIYLPSPAASEQVYCSALTITPSIAAGSGTDIHVANGDGLLWTTASGDWPFDIMISGERITITGVTGSEYAQCTTTDGTWESGTVGQWYGQNATVTVSTTAQTGSYALGVQAVTPANPWSALTTVATPVLPGATYQIQAGIRQAPSTYAVNGSFSWYDVNGSFIGTTLGNAVTPSASYTYQTITSGGAVAPSNAASVIWGIRSAATTSGLYYAMDNVVLQALDQRMVGVRGVNGVQKALPAYSSVELATGSIISLS